MKQGYNARLDESLGMRHKGPHKQSLAARRRESEGMEKAEGKRKFSGAKTMDKGSSLAKKHMDGIKHHMKGLHQLLKGAKKK